jgi:hypothetical protein
MEGADGVAAVFWPADSVPAHLKKLAADWQRDFHGGVSDTVDDQHSGVIWRKKQWELWLFAVTGPRKDSTMVPGIDRTHLQLLDGQRDSNAQWFSENAEPLAKLGIVALDDLTVDGSCTFTDIKIAGKAIQLFKSAALHCRRSLFRPCRVPAQFEL